MARQKDDFIVVIPSRRRAEICYQRSYRVFSGCELYICIEDGEIEDYARYFDRAMLVGHPPLSSIGEKRQWILDNFSDEILVMADDDITFVYDESRDEGRFRIDSPEIVREILANTANLAYDIGARVFGYKIEGFGASYESGIREGLFSFSRFPQGVFGVIGRPSYRFEDMVVAEDYDFMLSALLYDRYLLVDLRYRFKADMQGITGGNSMRRDFERVKRDYQLLKRRWGKSIRIIRRRRGGGIYIIPQVARRAKKVLGTG